MKLPYKEDVVSQDIDISKLRPGASYDHLISNRASGFAELGLDSEAQREFQIRRNCPMCSQSQFTHEHSKDQLDIVQCTECGLIYVNPIFDEKKYQELYKTKNYQEINKNLTLNSHDYRRERFGKERMHFIEENHVEGLPRTLLDVGCSTGFLLEEAQTRGWKAIGLELNPLAASYGRQRGLTIIEKTLDEVPVETQFSAITLFDVLEHLPNPAQAIKLVRKRLLPGGNVYIYVPNWNSASRMLLGVADAHFIWPTHHLTYFTPATLDAFLSRNSFSVFHWETQGLDMIDWLWRLEKNGVTVSESLNGQADTLQFYINSSGHGKNLRMFARKVAK